MEWINFRHLYSFWMVTKCGGFKRAAEKMHVSQSAISEQVALLEDYLQTRLLDRSTRSLTITPKGREVVEYAENIFKISKEINHVIKDQEKKNYKNLKVGIVGGVSRNLLYRIFSDFQKNSGSTIEVFNGNYEDLAKACRNFEIDFFISNLPAMGKDLMDFNSRVLEESPMCIAGNQNKLKEFKLKKDKFKISYDLAVYKHPFGEGDLADHIKEHFKKDIQQVLKTDDVSLLRFFANSQKALVILPEIGIKEDLLEKRISKIRLSFLESVKFYCVYPNNRERPKILE